MSQMLRGGAGAGRQASSVSGVERDTQYCEPQQPLPRGGRPRETKHNYAYIPVQSGACCGQHRPQGPAKTPGRTECAGPHTDLRKSLTPTTLLPQVSLAGAVNICPQPGISKNPCAQGNIHTAKPACGRFSVLTSELNITRVEIRKTQLHAHLAQDAEHDFTSKSRASSTRVHQCPCSRDIRR